MLVRPHEPTLGRPKMCLHHAKCVRAGARMHTARIQHCHIRPRQTSANAYVRGIVSRVRGDRMPLCPHANDQGNTQRVSRAEYRLAIINVAIALTWTRSVPFGAWSKQIYSKLEHCRKCPSCIRIRVDATRTLRTWLHAAIAAFFRSPNKNIARILHVRTGSHLDCRGRED